MAHFRFFGLGGKGKKQDKRQEPEEEGMELQDLTSEGKLLVPKKEIEEEEKAEPEAEVIDPEVQKARDKTKAELEFARSLYDSEPVKKESKKAFSKISTLLIRYNRLQEVKNRQQEEGRRIKAQADAKLDAAMHEIQEATQKASLNVEMSDEERETIERQLKAEEARVREAYQAEVERSKNVSKYLGEELMDGLDKDNGGIRGALMLSGDTAFGKGYTMTDGGFEDKFKAGQYIQDVGGEEGTLMQQMSLLDNAVNTGGIDMDAGKAKKDTEGVAHVNLSQILRSITDDEAKKINAGDRKKLTLDMDLIKKSREDKSMDAMLGSKKQMKTVSEAAEERGIFYQIEDTGKGSYKLKQYGVNDATRQRKTGKMMGKAALKNIPVMSRYDFRNYTTFSNKSMFGDLWSIGQGRMKTRGKTAEERRKNVKAARMKFNEEVTAYRRQYREESLPKVNTNDKLANEMDIFKSEEIRSKEELVKAGLMDKAELERFRGMDEISLMQEKLKSAKNNNSAGHMLAAYKMMGASTQELLDFRLALIAYMVPVGKNTVAGIVNESHAVGVVGAEGSDNIADDADMKQLYALLRKSAAFIERKKSSDEEKAAYKWAVAKKKYKKNEDGSIEEVEVKPEKKPEQEKKKQSEEEQSKYWDVADDAGFETDRQINSDPLFGESNEIKVTDVKQGKPEDSWLLAPLASLAQSDPDYIRNKLVKQQDENLVEVLLYDEEGIPNYITVSKNVVEGGSNNSALWVRVVEKAAAALYAKTNPRKNNKIKVTDLSKGNTDLGMSMLFGKNSKKQVAFKEDDKQVEKGKVLEAIRDAITNKKVLTATSLGENEKELRALGLYKGQDYTILGEGEKKEGEETIRVRDPHGTASAKETVAAEGAKGGKAGRVKLKHFEDGVIELKISDFLKSFSGLSVGEIKKDSNEKNEEKEPEKKEPEKVEKEAELMDLKAAFTSIGVEEGAGIIEKWQELGNKLWNLAYVEMGKEYLDGVLLHIDNVISALSEKLPPSTDVNFKKIAASIQRKISIEYNAIEKKGMDMATDLPGKDFTGCDEAAKIVLEMINLALQENKYFYIGTSNMVLHPENNKDLQERKPWVTMIMQGRNMPEEEKVKDTDKEKKEPPVKPDEEEKPPVGEQKPPEGEIKAPEGEPKAPEGEVKVPEVGPKAPEGEPKAPEGEIKPPVVELKPPAGQEPGKEHKEEKKEEKPGDKQEEKQEGVAEKPLDAAGYSKRWNEMAEKLNVLTARKIRTAQVLLLQKNCEQLSQDLAEKIPKGRKGSILVDSKKHLFIEQRYQEIRELASKIVADLIDAGFEGSKEIEDHLRFILECSMEETELFERGRDILYNTKSKTQLSWADALVSAKRDIDMDAEAGTAAAGFVKEAEIVADQAKTRAKVPKDDTADINQSKDDGMKDAIEMVELGEKKDANAGGGKQEDVNAGGGKQEDAPKQPEGGIFDDAEKIEMDGPAYIAAWNVLKTNLLSSSAGKFKAKDKKQAELIKATNDLTKAIGGIIELLGLTVNLSPDGKHYFIRKDMPRLYSQYYRLINGTCGVIAAKMTQQGLQNPEMIRVLKQLFTKSKTEEKLLITGMRTALKKPVHKMIWADFLVYGKQTIDEREAAKKAAQQEKGNPDPEIVVQPKVEKEVPKVEPPKGDQEQPKVDQEQPKVEQPNGDQEQPKVEPPKVEKEVPKGDQEQPKVEPPKVEKEVPKGDQEQPKVEQEPPKDKNDQHEEEVEDPQDEELKELIDGDKDPEVDDEAAFKKLQEEVDAGDYDDEELDEELKNNPQYKATMEEMKKLQKQQEEIAAVLTGKKAKKKPGRRNTIGGAGSKQSQPKIQRRMTMDFTHESAPDKPKPVKKVDKAKEKAALDKGAKEVGRQSFVPITTGEKAKNRVVWAAQYLWGTAMLPVNLVALGITKLLLIHKKSKRPENVQQNRSEQNRKNIKGRGTKSLADKEVPKDKDGKELVYDDTRNVPLVWEFITAGDTEEEPEMSINVDQPVPGKTKTSTGNNGGHTFISLSYTRYNKSTDSKERYKVEYGFYPKDGTEPTALGLNQGMKALIPGKLSDDRGRGYTISKSYNISTKSVNEILKASEHYADQGYNIATRNCTTFAVEMGRIAGVPIADQIKETEYELGTAARIGAVFFGGLAPSARYKGEMDFEDLLTQEDTGYQYYGQKKATLEEREAYKKSRSLVVHTPVGYSPSVAGETIRNVKDEKGLTMANLDTGVGEGDLKNLGIKADELTTTIINRFVKLYQEEKGIEKDVSEGKDDGKGNVTKPRYDMLQKIQEKGLWSRLKRYVPEKHVGTKADLAELKAFRKELNDWRKDFASFISAYPEYAKTCMEESMMLMSVIEDALTILDRTYVESIGDKYTGDLKHLRERYTKNKVQMGYKGADDKTHSFILEPTLIEAYLQMFGSMDEAAPKMIEYCKYRDLLAEAETDAEKDTIKEQYDATEKLHQTAKQFADSHRYLFNRSSFDKEELDYAFKQLPEIEKPGENATVSGFMVEAKITPSATLQTLMLEPVFKGIGTNAGELINKSNKDQKTTWVKDRMMRVVRQEDNKKELKRILAYFKKDSQGKSDEEVAGRFMNAVFDSFLPNFLIEYITDTDEMQEVIEVLRQDPEFKNYVSTVLAEITAEELEGEYGSL